MSGEENRRRLSIRPRHADAAVADMAEGQFDFADHLDFSRLGALDDRMRRWNSRRQDDLRNALQLGVDPELEPLRQESRDIGSGAKIIGLFIDGDDSFPLF